MLWLTTRYADVAELADAHGSGPCAARLKGSTPFVGTIMRVWHNGCAPAFQAGYRGSTPLTRSNQTFGGIPERPKGADCKSASTAFDGSNPSPTTTYENTDHCECDGLFYFRKHAAGRLRFVPRQGRFISAAGRCFIRRSRASFFFSAVPLKQTFTDFYRQPAGAVQSIRPKPLRKAKQKPTGSYLYRHGASGANIA